jgi:Zn-dependent peptidase ImmA (M78 family)/transcriptional regulator with XRE-family HTH domain
MPVAESIPINPEVLTWARMRAGLSVDELVRNFPKIGAWEQNEGSPTYQQLERLADRLRVPIAVFFFPEIPAVPDIEGTFRTLPAAEFDRIPSRVRLLLRKGRAFQLNLSELTGGQMIAPRLITNDLTFDLRTDIAAMARDVREYLGVSLVDQQQWGDTDTALKTWRKTLHNVGIWVFKEGFRVEEFSGFCLYDEIYPLIYVNNSCAKTRQIFTLFHELAHLLFHTSGIDTQHDSYIPHLKADAQTIEIICNQFVAEFLLPEAEFDRASGGLPANEVTAERLAGQYHVSRESVFRRFLDRELITERVYAEAAARWFAQMGNGGDGGNWYWSKLTYLGQEYVSLVLSQYHQNRIDEGQASDYLDTKPKNMGRLEEYFESVAP